MATGKQRRMARLLGEDGKTFIVAVDHSFTTGRLGGLSDMTEVLRAVVQGGADAVIGHRGTVTRSMPLQRHTGAVIHLSGSSVLCPDDDTKTRVCDPEVAMALGADAVSAQLTVGAGNRNDRKAFADIRRITRSCDQLGLPLLLMTYVRVTEEKRANAILHAARIAEELGADIVKAAHPGEHHLADLASTVTVPVVIAGGEAHGSWNGFLSCAENIIAAGLAGLCVGRRIFGHAEPARATAELREVIHGRSDQ